MLPVPQKGPRACFVALQGVFPAETPTVRPNVRPNVPPGGARAPSRNAPRTLHLFPAWFVGKRHLQPAKGPRLRSRRFRIQEHRLGAEFLSGYIQRRRYTARKICLGLHSSDLLLDYAQGYYLHPGRNLSMREEI